MKKLFTTIFVVTICYGFIYAQSRFDDVVIKTNKVTDNIYMLEGSGGNIGVFIGDDGVFMIDDQYAPLSEKIKTAITALSDKKIKYLVNTHWHGDHAGGNENFGKGGATIIAHENVRKRLSTEQHNKAFNRTTPASPKVAWPTITFEENMSLHLNGEKIMLIHVHNAHTDGDSFVWFPESNVLHMGDCFFKDRFPYIDIGSGGTVPGALRAIEVAMMLTDADTKIIPGHGTMARKSDLLRYYQMLSTMYDRVKKEVVAGKTIDQIKAAGLTDDYASWGGGFINADRIIDIIWTYIDSQLSK